MASKLPEPARGAQSNLKNRFSELEVVFDPEEDVAGESRRQRTQFLRDGAQSILTRNDSPDIPFGLSINPYRGCEHGCAYCFARPTHEFLGFSAGLDFESRILVKENAAELLRRELSHPRYHAEPVALSTVTDCYQPIERRLGLTRQCLEVLAGFRHPVGIITKNHLVNRDIDLLASLALHGAVRVAISLTTLDGELAASLEPRASRPERRLAAIRELSAAGIPCSILMAPCIPGLTDHEIPSVFAAAAAAGALDAHVIPLRLPGAVAPLFEAWLKQHRPGSAEKILGRIRDLRGGRLNDPNFHSRFRGQGIHAGTLHGLARAARRKCGFPGLPPLESKAFLPAQPELF